MSSVLQHLPAKDQRFVTTTFGDGDSPQFADWVRKLRGSKEEKRLIAISNYKFFSAKRQKLTKNRTVQREAHLYDLKEINVESANQVMLRFKVFYICFEHPELQRVLNILRQAIQKITVNFPIHLVPTLNLPDHIRLDPLPELINYDNQAFVNTYYAMCVYLNLPVCQRFLQYIEQEKNNAPNQLDLGRFVKEPKITTDLKPVLLSLRYDTYYQVLDFSDVSGHKEFLSLCAETIQGNSTLNVLRFESIDTEGLQEFGTSLGSNRNIKQIFLARNKFPKGFPAFCTGIQGLKSNLTHLDLTQGNIPAKSMAMLFQALGENEQVAMSLTHLLLAGNTIDEPASRSFSQAFSRVANRAVLERLDLGNTGVTVSTVFSAISTNFSHCLRFLSLVGSKMDDSTCQAVGVCLQNYHVLEELLFANCRITEAGLSSIFMGLGSNNKLARICIDMQNNEIGSKKSSGAHALKQGFRAIKSLEELNIQNNPLQVKEYLLIFEELKLLNKFRRFELGVPQKQSMCKQLCEWLCELCGQNNLQYLGLSAVNSKVHYGKDLIPLFRSIAFNSSLRELDLRDNQTGEQGIEILLNSLRENKSIVSLQLDGNLLGYTFWVKLFQYLEKHPTLVKLDMPEKDIARAINQNKDKKRDILSLWADIQSLCLNRRTGGFNPNYAEYRMSLSVTKQLELDRADNQSRQVPLVFDETSDTADASVSPRANTVPPPPEPEYATNTSPALTPVSPVIPVVIPPPTSPAHVEPVIPAPVIPVPVAVPEPEVKQEPVQTRQVLPRLVAQKQATAPPPAGISPSQVKPGLIRPARKKVQSMDMFGTIYGSQDPLLLDGENPDSPPADLEYVMAEEIPPKDLPTDPPAPETPPPEPPATNRVPPVSPVPLPVPVAAASAPGPVNPPTPGRLVPPPARPAPSQASPDAPEPGAGRGRPPMRAQPPLPAPRQLARAGTVGNTSSIAKPAPPPPARPSRALGGQANES